MRLKDTYLNSDITEMENGGGGSKQGRGREGEDREMKVRWSWQWAVGMIVKWSLREERLRTMGSRVSNERKGSKVNMCDLKLIELQVTERKEEYEWAREPEHREKDRNR